MNILDTRELNDRLDELATIETSLLEAKEALVDAEWALEAARLTLDAEAIELAEVEVEECQATIDKCEELDVDDAKELEELREMESEISEWRHGATLIPESDFEEYCEELCEDIGDIPKDLPHYMVIDWESTSNNLRADYSEIEYMGENYLYRS